MYLTNVEERGALAVLDVVRRAPGKLAELVSFSNSSVPWARDMVGVSADTNSNRDYLLLKKTQLVD